MTVEVPEPLAGRLAAEAARLGVDPAELAIEGRYGHDASGPGGTEAQAALDAFIGCGDSGDPDWASRNIHDLRSDGPTTRR